MGDKIIQHESTKQPIITEFVSNEKYYSALRNLQKNQQDFSVNITTITNFLQTNDFKDIDVLVSAINEINEKLSNLKFTVTSKDDFERIDILMKIFATALQNMVNEKIKTITNDQLTQISKIYDDLSRLTEKSNKNQIDDLNRIKNEITIKIKEDLQQRAPSKSPFSSLQELGKQYPGDNQTPPFTPGKDSQGQPTAIPKPDGTSLNSDSDRKVTITESTLSKIVSTINEAINKKGIKDTFLTGIQILEQASTTVKVNSEKTSDGVNLSYNIQQKLHGSDLNSTNPVPFAMFNEKENSFKPVSSKNENDRNRIYTLTLMSAKETFGPDQEIVFKYKDEKDKLMMEKIAKNLNIEVTFEGPQPKEKLGI